MGKEKLNDTKDEIMKEKGELLNEINSILEVLPACECLEIKEYILGVYLT